MNQYNTKPSPLELLEQLAKHPHGLELANLVYELHQKGQADTEPEPRQVGSALHQVKFQGVEDSPYFRLLVTRIQNLERRLNSVEERLKYLEDDLDLHSNNCQLKDIRLHQVKFQGVEDSPYFRLLVTRIQNLERRLNSVEERQNSVEADLDSNNCQLKDIRLSQVKPQGIEDEDILHWLLTRIQHLEERQNSVEKKQKYLEFDLHSNYCQLKDQRLGDEPELYYYSEDN